MRKAPELEQLLERVKRMNEREFALPPIAMEISRPGELRARGAQSRGERHLGYRGDIAGPNPGRRGSERVERVARQDES